MQVYLQSLLTGLTTVFAWAPCAVLLCMPIVGIYTGLFYIAEIGLMRIALLVMLTLSGVAGFVGLSAVCWPLKLSTRHTLFCLISGLLTLILVITIGYLSGNPMFALSLSVIEIYLFIGPMLFLCIHIMLLSKKLVHLSKTL